MIRRYIPLAFSLGSSMSCDFARSRVAHSWTKRYCIFALKWHQLWEFIQNELKGSTIPADKCQTSIQEHPDLRLYPLAVLNHRKEENVSWRVYSGHRWVPFPSSHASTGWDKKDSILSHFSSSQARSSAFWLFDSGFRPENLNISLSLTIRIRYIKWGLKFISLPKIFGSFALSGRDSHRQQLHRVMFSLAESIAGCNEWRSIRRQARYLKDLKEFWSWGYLLRIFWDATWWQK
jgi:hypothetical protein